VWTEHGEPSDVEQAAHLAETNPYDFRWWAVRLLGGRPPRGEKKKGGDAGIDGELTWIDRKGAPRRGIVSVEGRRTLTPDFVKALSEAVRQEKADFGVLVTMHEPTQGVRATARDCGAAPWSAQEERLAHRIRIVTVPEIMAEKVQLSDSRSPRQPQKAQSRKAPPPAAAR
jgi:hypothetical protein